MERATSDDPLGGGAVDDRSKSVGDRRSSPRTKTLKGAQIFRPAGNAVKCIVRNLSETGAKIEVHSPIPATFDLVFDSDQTRKSCRVVWRVRHQRFRDSEQGKLREALAHLVDDVTRLAVGVASDVL
jgi:PilZ domain-containing protein